MEDQRIVMKDQRSELPSSPYSMLDDEFRPPAPGEPEHNNKDYDDEDYSGCFWLCCFLFFLPFAVLLCVVIFFATYTPTVPSFTVDAISIRTLEINATELTIHSQMAVSMRVDNVNERFGFYYRKYGSRVTVVYRRTTLCQGLLPTFAQAVGEITIFDVEMEGFRGFDETLQAALRADQGRGLVPLNVYVRAPMSLRVFDFPFAQMVVNVAASTVVSALSPNSTIDIRNADTEYETIVES